MFINLTDWLSSLPIFFVIMQFTNLHLTVALAFFLDILTSIRDFVFLIKIPHGYLQLVVPNLMTYAIRSLGLCPPNLLPTWIYLVFLMGLSCPPHPLPLLLAILSYPFHMCQWCLHYFIWIRSCVNTSSQSFYGTYAQCPTCTQASCSRVDNSSLATTGTFTSHGNSCSGWNIQALLSIDLSTINLLSTLVASFETWGFNLVIKSLLRLFAIMMILMPYVRNKLRI